MPDDEKVDETDEVTAQTADDLRAAAAPSDEIHLPAKLLKSARRICQTFQGPSVSFEPIGAALLTAYLVATEKDAENFGRTQAEVWAASFARLYPVPWHAAKVGNLAGFVAALKRQPLECPPADELRQLTMLVQG